MSTGKILLVDDDPALRELMTAVLRDAGHDVTSATDGLTAWNALGVERFDVLVTDYEMPRLSGLQLLRRVRAGPRTLPVVFISGSMPSTEPDLFRLLPPGVPLEKPFSLFGLLAVIQDLLALAPLEREAARGQALLAFSGRDGRETGIRYCQG